MKTKEVKFNKEGNYWYLDGTGSNEIWEESSQLDGWFTIEDLIRIAEKMKKLESGPRPGHLGSHSDSDISRKSLRSLMSLHHIS